LRGREETLAEEDQAWADLMEAMAAVPAERRDAEGVVPGWSTHDTVWHTAYWVGRAADVLDLATQGPPYPAEPDDESYYDEENAQVFATGRGMTWDEVLAYFTAGRGRARGAMERCAESDLEWMSERFSEEIGHFREHGSQIHAFAAGQRGVVS
jgi:hypothetical protein